MPEKSLFQISTQKVRVREVSQTAVNNRLLSLKIPYEKPCLAQGMIKVEVYKQISSSTLKKFDQERQFHLIIFLVI